MDRFEWVYETRFQASDKAGNIYEIEKWTRYQIWNYSDGGGRAATTFRLQTDSGLPVECISKGVYDVMHPRGPIRITTDNPMAPGPD